MKRRTFYNEMSTQQFQKKKNVEVVNPANTKHVIVEQRQNQLSV